MHLPEFTATYPLPPARFTKMLLGISGHPPDAPARIEWRQQPAEHAAPEAFRQIVIDEDTQRGGLAGGRNLKAHAVATDNENVRLPLCLPYLTPRRRVFGDDLFDREFQAEHGAAHFDDGARRTSFGLIEGVRHTPAHHHHGGFFH